MPIKAKTYYIVECDECGMPLNDTRNRHDDATAFRELKDAVNEVQEYGWQKKFLGPLVCLECRNKKDYE